MTTFLETTAIIGLIELALAAALTLLPRVGRLGRAVSDACARAPLLDLILAALTWIPWLAAGLLAGWTGLAGAIFGQMLAIFVWVIIHELANHRAATGPRIGRFWNRRIGWWHNHLALWVSVVALPGLWVIRLTEIFGYPLLVWLLRFPAYRYGEWVNVSRQKFQGLIGHDLLWCLYCDWMTGVYSLGAEMLRNVESFWCPIRFHDGRKCEHCRIDFPDIDGGWIPADGSMRDVEQLMQRKYGGSERSWFGHPARLTIDGAAPESKPHG